MLLSQLKKGEKAVIKKFDIQSIPLKLVELGCLPENEVELLQIAPLGCPYYFIINDTRVAIRKETAKQIEVEKL
ncbi:MAG: ferrous iron transport protein A [Flavobacteriaceae bacterium]